MVTTVEKKKFQKDEVIKKICAIIKNNYKHKL